MIEIKRVMKYVNSANLNVITRNTQTFNYNLILIKCLYLLFIYFIYIF